MSKTINSFLDVLALFTVGGFIIYRAINDKIPQTIDFFVKNGLQIIKFLAAILALLGFGYLLPKKIRGDYQLFLMLCFAASKNVQKFISKLGE